MQIVSRQKAMRYVPILLLVFLTACARRGRVRQPVDDAPKTRVPTPAAAASQPDRVEQHGADVSPPRSSSSPAAPRTIQAEHLPILEAILKDLLKGKIGTLLAEMPGKEVEARAAIPSESRWVVLTRGGTHIEGSRTIMGGLDTMSGLVPEWPTDFRPEVGGFRFRHKVQDVRSPDAICIGILDYGPLTANERAFPFRDCPAGHWKLILFVIRLGDPAPCGLFVWYSFEPQSGTFRLRHGRS